MAYRELDCSRFLTGLSENLDEILDQLQQEGLDN